MTSQAIIIMKSLCKFYTMGDQVVRALDSIDLDFKRNDYAAIMGPSGSGKSTLMNSTCFRVLTVFGMSNFL